MDLLEYRGDLLDSEAQIIVHQVNCMGVMGSGIAKSIRERYPEVYREYKETLSKLDCFGGCLLVDTHEYPRKVANIFGQYFYRGCIPNAEMLSFPEPWKQPEFNIHGEPTRFTNYEALYRGLSILREKLEGTEVLGFPEGLGSFRGGGSWRIVKEIIIDVFKNTNYQIEIWKL